MPYALLDILGVLLAYGDAQIVSSSGDKPIPYASIAEWFSTGFLIRGAWFDSKWGHAAGEQAEDWILRPLFTC